MKQSRFAQSWTSQQKKVSSAIAIGTLTAKLADFWNPVSHTSRIFIQLVSIVSLSALVVVAVAGFFTFLLHPRQFSLNILLYGMVVSYVMIAAIFFGGHRAQAVTKR